jgi:hypothetical protein
MAKPQPSRREAARHYATTNREQGGRVADAQDRENVRDSRGRSNAPRAIRNRATGNDAQRRG